jgi:hypothetical protein
MRHGPPWRCWHWMVGNDAFGQCRVSLANAADRMRSAMPNAFVFGLTGTPIELNGRHTPKASARKSVRTGWNGA